MNKLRRSLYATGVLIIIAFVALASWFGYTVYSQGRQWVGSKYNQRVSSYGNMTISGSIFDRYGVVLAQSDENGNREYNSDELLRRSVSQTVGDQLNMSGSGVETYHSDLLTGYSGTFFDRFIAAVRGKEYSGSDIILTIDANLCRYIAQIFPSGFEGAVCVINYKTGEILAMVSKPDYDPQNLGETWIYNMEGSCFFNRCLQGQYTPGSVFKIVTLAGALENLEGVQQNTYYCDAAETFGNTTVKCQSGRLAHGRVNLQNAFMQSCNCTFATVACDLGAKNLLKTAKGFAFNTNFSFDDVMLYSSSYSENVAGSAELAWTGVGQGQTTVTPLHMAMIAGSVANKGIMMEPLLLLKVSSAGGTVSDVAVPSEYKRTCRADTAETIVKYMYRTVKSGTAQKAAVDGHIVCGKTGSAEVSGDKNIETNSWFVGFLAEDEYPFAIAAVIEQGGAGSNLASSLSGSVLRRAIALQDVRNAN